MMHLFSAGLRMEQGQTAPMVPMYELQFEWGLILVNDTLLIGRDPEFSPLAARLVGYDTVSRRHATVTLRNGILRVTHIGTTNPTYLNGRPLDTGESAAMGDGDILRFSREVRAVVQISRARVHSE